MARTPLVNWFRQLYRDFDEAEKSGSSVEEVQRARMRPSPSRRDFLKTTGAAAAAGAGFSFARPAALSAARAPRIAIIGGGIAGLNAALTLRDAGIASTIYEASNRIGGRMHSDTTSWANGQVTEHCGELIDSNHATIIGLAQRFGLHLDDLHAAEPPNSTDTVYVFGSYYLQAQANLDFAAVYTALKTDLHAARYPTLYNSYTAGGLALDLMSAYEWIDTRVPGGHSSPMGQLLDVAYNIEYGAETTEQSSLNVVYLLGYQPKGTKDFAVFGQSDERYHITGGNERLPVAIASSLPAGSIQLGTSLTAISKNSDGTYKLSLSKGGSNFSVQADRVILTVPFSILRTLDYSQAAFNNVKVIGIQELGYGTNAKLHLQFTERLWNRVGPWGVGTGGSIADTGYQNTWDVTRAQPGATGILVDYTGGNTGASFTGNPTNRGAVQNYAKDFLRQLEPVFPGITNQWMGKATLDTPAKNPYSLGSYSYWKVGQYTRFSGSEAQRSGNCHFAGEHCSTNFPGFMEGGAAEGARAAGEILSDYQRGIFP